MLRVMLVDDSHKDISLLKEGLKAAGYDVVEVSTTAAALLERVAAAQPDVIIIDSDSPTRDTLEQLSFVHAKQPRPIVLFTEDRDNRTIQAALKAGVSAYVVAGMQPERLQPILDVAVARFEQDVSRWKRSPASRPASQHLRRSASRSRIARRRAAWRSSPGIPPTATSRTGERSSRRG